MMFLLLVNRELAAEFRSAWRLFEIKRKNESGYGHGSLIVSISRFLFKLVLYCICDVAVNQSPAFNFCKLSLVKWVRLVIENTVKAFQLY